MKIEYLSPLVVQVKNAVPGFVAPDLKPSTEGSAAVDLKACIHDEFTLMPGEMQLVSTGTAIHISDPNVAGIIVPRSGLATKHGIVLANTVGLIDSDYQGEIMLALLNRSETPFPIKRFDRLAQMFFVPILHPKFQKVTDFSKTTQRGEKGLGSTGTS